MAENGGAQLPVLTLDFDDAKIKALNELAEKFKAAFAIGPGGFPVPAQPTVAPPSPTVPGQAPGGGGGKGKKESEDFLKYLNKELQGTLKTFRLINRTLKKTTSTLKGLFTTTVSWGTKIAAISGGGMFGYGYMSHRVTEQYKSSQGLGMTTGQTQAAHNVFGTRFGFIDNTMQALANGKNPASQEYRALRALGLNPQASAGENLPKFLSAVDRVRKQNGTNAQAVLESMGVGWVGATGLNQMAANSYQIPLLNQQYADQSRQLDQDMGDGTQKSYQDLKANFEKNADEIGNTFLNALKQLNGPITQVSDELTANIKQFLNGGNGQALFKTVADGLKELGAWLGSEKFQKDLDTFSKAVRNVALAIGTAIEWLANYGIKAPESVEDARNQSSFDVNRSEEELKKKGMTKQEAINDNGGVTGLLKALGNTTLALVTGGNVTVDAIQERWKYGGWNGYDESHTTGTKKTNVQAFVEAVNKTANLPNGLMSAIAQKESSWNPLALNKKSGAAGLFQFMPGTAKAYGLEGDDVFDPNKATVAAGKYLHDLSKRYKGDIAKMLTIYDGGKINEDGNLNLKKETVDYLLKILQQVDGAVDQHPGIIRQLRAADDVLSRGGANDRAVIDLHVTTKPGGNIDAQVKGINLWNGK